VIDALLTHYNYYAVVLLLGIGVYMLVESPNLIKKVIGMNIFQTGIFLFSSPRRTSRVGPHPSSARAADRT